MKNKKSKNVIMMLAGLLLGAVLGFLVMHKLNIAHSADKSDKILRIAVMLISLGVSSFGSIIIHESGHLVMGLLTGYKFVSFRVGSFLYLSSKTAGSFSDVFPFREQQGSAL